MSPETKINNYEVSSYKAVKFYNETNTPKVIKLIMKYSGGVIKDQKAAEYFLFGFIILAIGVSLLLFFGEGNTPQPPSTAQLEQMRLMQINR